MGLAGRTWKLVKEVLRRCLSIYYSQDLAKLCQTGFFIDLHPPPIPFAMTTTREANVINADDGKLNGEREAGQAGEQEPYDASFLGGPPKPRPAFWLEDRAPKRRKIEKSDFSTPSADLAYVPGSSPGEGRSNVTLDQMQLITRRNGRGGKLRDMMNMHEDILDEVCVNLRARSN